MFKLIYLSTPALKDGFQGLFGSPIECHIGSVNLMVSASTKCVFVSQDSLLSVIFPITC